MKVKVKSLYDVDKNIDDLSDLDTEFVEARQSNIQEQVSKEKAARINVDEIPSGSVGINVGFEDINKNKRGRYEGKLGGDDLYFDSSDLGSDISEDKGDPVESDEKNCYTTGTARTATGGSGGATTSTTSTGVTGGATGGSGGSTTSAASAGVTAGGSGGAATKRPVITPAACRGATTAATCTD
uniref:Transposon MuDR mudrA n=1 Tax=Solanum tuberosum TaxID=4113 RepID=M1D810_SOLTU